MGGDLNIYAPLERAVDSRYGAWLQVGGSFMLATFMYSLLASLGRAIQLRDYLESGGGDQSVLVYPIVPALLKAIGVFVAASIYCKNTGGLVFHGQYIANLIMFHIYSKLNLFKTWMKGTKCNMTTSIFFDKEGKEMDVGPSLLDLAFNSVAMLIGYFLGSLLVGAVVGYADAGSYQVIAQAPGVFPGFNANTNDAFTTIDGPRAVIVELIATAILGLYFTFSGLNITRRAMMPDSVMGDEDKQDRSHMKAVRGGALLVFALSCVTNNISGGSYDLAHWVSANFAASILSGQTLFSGGAFANVDEYWYVYVFGPLAGWIAGAGIGYLSFGWVFRPVKNYQVVDQSEQDPLTMGSKSSGRRSRQTRERVNEILGQSDLFAQQ